MKTIYAASVTDAVARLCMEANTLIGCDIYAALREARAKESLPLPCAALDMLLENADIAARDKIPMCQDTGMAVVFVDIGQSVHIVGSLADAIQAGVRRGYQDGYGRASVVRDPVRRVNTKDNTPAVIFYDIIPGDTLHITVMPKGFGSENMSAVSMLLPADGLPGVEAFIIETVKKAGANPCPPIIVGVGVGGTMEKAALMAKQALYQRTIGSRHADAFWAESESRLLEKINALAIGPAGFGGQTTALGVHIMTHPTHIAGLPVAVNISCHACRHQSVSL